MKKSKIEKTIILAPFDEKLEPQERTDICIELSELMMKIATHIICYTLVDYREQLKDERLSIAHAFLQRSMTTHLCNHKLTAEGLVLEYRGEPFMLHEEYKTMTLTRTVYEHLAMFYFLFEHPRTADERELVWKYWQLNSKKNLLDDSTDVVVTKEQEQLLQEIETLRTEILSSPIGQQCRRNLAEWTRTSSRPVNGSIECVLNDGKYEVKKVSYNQAWRYLFKNEDTASFYRSLSMHCHPVYHGLLQYQYQSVSDQGHDGIPLYFSCRFLAHLCRLFLKQLPGGYDIIKKEFSDHQLSVFRALSQLPKD